MIDVDELGVYIAGELRCNSKTKAGPSELIIDETDAVPLYIHEYLAVNPALYVNKVGLIVTRAGISVEKGGVDLDANITANNLIIGGTISGTGWDTAVANIKSSTAQNSGLTSTSAVSIGSLSIYTGISLYNSSLVSKGYMTGDGCIGGVRLNVVSGSHSISFSDTLGFMYDYTNGGVNSSLTSTSTGVPLTYSTNKLEAKSSGVAIAGALIVNGTALSTMQYKEMIALNCVASQSSTTVGGVAPTGWTYSYTGTGGSQKVSVYITCYTGTAPIARTWILRKIILSQPLEAFSSILQPSIQLCLC